jgi:hypothetical protein
MLTMKTPMETEWQELRRKLPGGEYDTILAHDSEKEKWLIHKFSIRGCCDELIAVTCYWVVKPDPISGTKTFCYTNIDEAVKEYAKV